MESNLKEEESEMVASRVKRQLVGSERCGQHHHHHHRHSYRNLYHQHNHYYHHHSVSESVIDIVDCGCHPAHQSDIRIVLKISGIFCRYKEDWDDGREGRAYGYYRYRDDPRFVLKKL